MKEIMNCAKLLDIKEAVDFKENTIYIPDGCNDGFLWIDGNHWKIRTVSLFAFSDDTDTLIGEKETLLFATGVKEPIEGNIFFLDNIATGESLFICSEAPDYVTSKLKICKRVVSLENDNNAIAIGFAKTERIEALCRGYLKNAMINKLPRTMSNTWGDRNGYSRICRDFVLREIEAAKDIGVDIVQIDDGWQTGNTYDPSIRDEKGMRRFRGDFWEYGKEKFPEGMIEITRAAKEAGLKLGIWFAPDSENNYALIDRDISVLKKAYDEWGVRFFKLDMYWIESDENKRQFMKLLNAVYSFGDDVAVQLDVTRDKRINYLCGKEYGSIFVENRYTLSQNAYPYRVLRSLWGFSKYLPTTRFQFELVNPDLGKDSYPENDDFAPSHYGMDYLFASVMLSNPLFWMELQFLAPERREELKPIMKVWREIRDEIAYADVSPIGQRPCGRSFTGFKIKGKDKSYILVFRELTDNDSFSFDLGEGCKIVKTVISNHNVDASINGECVNVTFAEQRTYALIEIAQEV
jgi:alpha-galactosidase